jgi:hypothetical protein
LKELEIELVEEYSGQEGKAVIPAATFGAFAQPTQIGQKVIFGRAADR